MVYIRALWSKYKSLSEILKITVPLILGAVGGITMAMVHQYLGWHMIKWLDKSQVQVVRMYEQNSRRKLVCYNKGKNNATEVTVELRFSQPISATQIKLRDVPAWSEVQKDCPETIRPDCYTLMIKRLPPVVIEPSGLYSACKSCVVIECDVPFLVSNSLCNEDPAGTERPLPPTAADYVPDPDVLEAARR